MTDEEFVFRQTERKTVRMPSDNLTRKEIEAMSGEITSWNLNKPCNWAEFKTMPDDIKREYVGKLRATYGVETGALAEMFGVVNNTVSACFRTLGISAPRGGYHRRTKEQARAWEEFCRGEETPTETATQPAEQELPPVEEKPEVIKTDVSNIATLLAALVGTGAKLTIELTL